MAALGGDIAVLDVRLELGLNPSAVGFFSGFVSLESRLTLVLPELLRCSAEVSKLENSNPSAWNLNGVKGAAAKSATDALLAIPAVI